MSTSLSIKDLIEINQPQIAEMQRVGDAFANPEMPAAFETFSKQVRLIEGVLTQSYGIAAAVAKREVDLNEVAETWDRMGAFCNSVLPILSALRFKFPNCGTPELYDLAWDYKLACDKRYNGVLQEITCTTKGLLPEPI